MIGLNRVDYHNIQCTIESALSNANLKVQCFFPEQHAEPADKVGQTVASLIKSGASTETLCSYIQDAVKQLPASQANGTHNA